MPIPTTNAPVARPSLRDEAYARLRDWIIDGTLAPGEPLRDEALAEALGMSRTPVREALQRLEDDGFVVTGPTRRTTVSPVTAQQARELYPIGAQLDALALRLSLPHVGPDDLDAMRAANGRLAEALAAGDPLAATVADEVIHRRLAERANNGELLALLDDLRAKVRRIEHAFWTATDRTPSLGDHERLIAALAAHDEAAALDALATNWARTLSWWVQPHTDTR